MKNSTWQRWRLALLALLPMTAVAAPEIGRIHALAPAAEGVLVAATSGLYLARADGRVQLWSDSAQDLFALAADPSDPQRVYASGNDVGLLRSTDGGKRWQRHDRNGPASLDLLTVSAADPQRLYGVGDGLYRSEDGGLTWSKAGMIPGKALYSLAASGKNPSTVYAGTDVGLMRSEDGGASWSPGSMFRIPATLIAPQPDGTLYGFNWGQGLLSGKEPSLVLAPLNNGFGGQAVMHLARTGEHLFAATSAEKLFVSDDDGRSWLPLGGYRPITGPAERRGEKLFATNCAACHGERGIGETPTFGTKQSALAPALDETAHAWHHEDDQLKNTILKGLPAPSRMVAWEAVLKERDAEDLVAYMKALWTPRALGCQGAKHMAPECQQK